MPIFGSLTPAAQWFVDSVAGSDANSGTSARLPLQTITALLAKSIVTGDLIALKCGSTWREKLRIVTDGVHVSSYGSGALPLLDCSDGIGAGAWSKTSGQTNVYQASLTCEATGSTWVSAWENDTRLVRATSLANCDATAGSYYPSSDSSTSFTLYVHASNDTSPGSNGKVYEFSKRYAGYDAITANVVGCRVTGIRTRRNLANDGSLLISKNGSAYNCTALEGSKHSVYLRTGATAHTVTASEAYFGSGDVILFVGNENTPTGEGLTFVNCAAMLTTYAANATGFYTHINTSGSFGMLVFDGCTSNNCNIGISGNNAARGIVRNCTVTNAGICYSCDHDWVLTDCSGQANKGGTPQVLFIGSTNVEVVGLTGSTTGSHWIWIGANCSAYIHDCDWSAGPIGPRMISLRAANGSVKVRRVKFHNTSTLPFTVTQTALATAVIDSDENVFGAHGLTDYVAQLWDDYQTFAQWQALGHDLNSVAA